MEVFRLPDVFLVISFPYCLFLLGLCLAAGVPVLGFDVSHLQSVVIQTDFIAYKDSRVYMRLMAAL